MRRYFASPWVEAQRRHLVAAAAGPTPRALDLGCGKGRHAMLLTDLGFEVTAVDCDGASLAQLRQREDKVKIVQMDLEEAGTSLMSLGHFDVLLVVNFACRSLLPKLPKLLKDDGIFIFESWAQGNESYATPKDAKALQGLLRPNELLEATADFTVLAYAHGLQEGYEGRDCVKQMICCKKNPQPGPHGHVVCPLARLLSGDAAFLEDAAFGKSWVHSVRAALELDFGIEELLNLLVGYDPATARKEYLARMGSSASRPALWDVVLVRRTEGRTESMKPEEVKEFLSKTDLKTKADVLKRGEGWTLVVSQLQGAPALAELHRRLFAATGLGGGINAYLTPPGSIGKPPHIDDHDVVVLQLSGSKCWTLLDDSRSNPRAEVTLAPKDVMYLPQGIPHHAAALAVDDPSLHLAVALHRRPMALSSVLAALLTLRSLDPGEGAMLQASVVEEMEGRSQSFAAFGAREHWLNQLLPMHLPLVHALAPEDVEIGILEAFCDLLHRRALDLAELVRSQDCSDADVGLPPGTARQRALLRASAAGSEMELEEAAKLPKQDFCNLCCAAFWTRREFVMEQHFRQSGAWEVVERYERCSLTRCALLHRGRLRVNGHQLQLSAKALEAACALLRGRSLEEVSQESSHAQEAAAELLRVGALEKSRLSLVDFNRTTEVTTVQKISCDKNML